MRLLGEGLKVGDLRKLVRPMVSLDEYESKLGDDAEIIVLAFFVIDQEPAQDLNRFLERGEVPLLDSEVSPAPTEDGLYLVFVELPRNERTADTVMDLVGSIKSLVAEDEWTFKPYGHTDIEDLTADNIKKFITLDRTEVLRRQKKAEAKKAAEAEKARAAKEAAEKAAEHAREIEKAKLAAAKKQKSDKHVKAKHTVKAGGDAISKAATGGEEEPEATAKTEHLLRGSRNRLMEFFQASLLDDLELDGGDLVLSAGRTSRRLRLDGFGRLPRLFEAHGLTDQPADLGIDAILDCNRLGRMLGPDWAIQRLGDRYVLAHGSYAAVVADAD